MLGAKHVTTVDYVNLVSEDPRITTLHANDLNEMFLKNELPEIDAIISFSSLEHSGLGRYVSERLWNFLSEVKSNLNIQNKFLATQFWEISQHRHIKNEKLISNVSI